MRLPSPILALNLCCITPSQVARDQLTMKDKRDEEEKLEKQKKKKDRKARGKEKEEKDSS